MVFNEHPVSWYGYLKTITHTKQIDLECVVEEGLLFWFFTAFVAKSQTNDTRSTRSSTNVARNLSGQPTECPLLTLAIPGPSSFKTGISALVHMGCWSSCIHSCNVRQTPFLYHHLTPSSFSFPPQQRSKKQEDWKGLKKRNFSAKLWQERLLLHKCAAHGSNATVPVSVQDSIAALRKAHMYSALSLNSLPKVDL